MSVISLVQLAAATSSQTVTENQAIGQNAGKAIALGLGTGFGAIGPGVGVGYIFGKTIESVTRQPEMKDEIQSIMWLGFALTEAIVFYALLMSLVAFFIA
jgi:F-type H+-transporting ATPase subunit c